MKIVKTYNRGIKGQIEIVHNEKLDNLLMQVPSHMKSWSYREKFIETLDYIFSSFSFLLEYNQEYDNIQIAEIIKEYYSLENLKVRYMYEFLTAF